MQRCARAGCGMTGDPILEWCLGNVVGKADRRGNLYPTKQRSDQKIDAAIALMMAIGPGDERGGRQRCSRWLSVEPAHGLMDRCL
jgi:phage terminase large subunit-like protein